VNESRIKVLGICGSLRSKSWNMMALRAAGQLMPPGMTLTLTAGIGDLPFYDQDLMDAGVPDPVQRFCSEVRAADALLIASPEYNFSVSAVLKNAIDWGSHVPDQVFREMPIAVLSATTGPLGGARVQYELRRILTPLWGHVLPRPEVFIGNAAGKFDTGGHLTDEATKKFVGDMLYGFREWVLRVRQSRFQSGATTPS
jgi:chromate reductase